MKFTQTHQISLQTAAQRYCFLFSALFACERLAYAFVCLCAFVRLFCVLSCVCLCACVRLFVCLCAPARLFVAYLFFIASLHTHMMINTSSKDHFSGSAVRKGVLLTRYVKFTKRVLEDGNGMLVHTNIARGV